ncbi:MAG: cytochrome c [Ignavibacteriaceae bacterium]|jgi:mono/diheme cytochrome c family protein
MKLLLTILLICPSIIFAQNNNSETQNKSGFSSEWIAPASANKLNNPLTELSEATNKGEKLFEQNCTTCHGTSGKGDGPTADMLDTKPADLTSPKVQKESDGALFWKITNGKGAMASYKKDLSEDQRWQLVNYIRKLGRDSVIQDKKK